MARVPRRISRAIERLLASAEKTLSLLVCFHDFLDRSGIARAWRYHRAEACVSGKRSSDRICNTYGGQEVHERALGHPDGWIHTCPRGHSEIAVPVFFEGMHAGVLFAGTFWLRKGPAPSGLAVPPSRAWLEERVPVVRAIATDLERLLEGDQVHLPMDRRGRVLAFLRETIERQVSLDDVAAALSLSSSRAAHAITEEFGVSFTALTRSVKMQEAMRLLASTRLPVSQVAALVGYPDPNYFSRAFSREQGMPPRAYRARVSGGV